MSEDLKKKILSCINSITTNGCDSFLHAACAEGREDIAKWLLENGANPNIATMNGTPLHEAILNSRDAIVLLLLCFKARPNDYDLSGRTPLYIAVEYREIKCIQHLMDYGAYAYKPFKFDPRSTPYSIASEDIKKIIDRSLGRE